MKRSEDVYRLIYFRKQALKQKTGNTTLEYFILHENFHMNVSKNVEKNEYQ